jgi:hypothetical protein
MSITLRKFSEDFDAPITSHLVRNTLPNSGLVVISGKEKSGKTFLALSLSLAISSGDPYWQSMPDRKISVEAPDGVVIYISAEGHAGFRLRKMAYAIHQGWDAEQLASIRLLDIQAAPNIRDKKALAELAAAIKKDGRSVVAIVIDTVARTIHGNENDGEVMSQYIDACDFLIHEFQTLVILVHHIGKDTEKGMRGHSSLVGAVDAELRVDKNGETRSVSIIRAKDIEECAGFFHFKLKPIVVGKDSDGNEVSSCVVVPCSKPSKRVKEPQPAVIATVGKVQNGEVSNEKDW